MLAVAVVSLGALSMVKVAIVADRPIPPWSARQLILAFELLGATAVYLRPQDLAAVFSGNEMRIVYSSTLNDIDIDAFVLRDIGFNTTIETFLRRVDLFKQAELMNIPVVNPVESMLIARDKYLSLLLLSRAGIPIPPTAVMENVHAAIRIAELWRDVVMKPLIGSMGFGAIRAANVDIVYTTSRTLNQLNQPIYIQKYVEKPNRDIRAFVVGDRLVAAYYRVQQDATRWKTNIAQGARAIPIKSVDPELENLAVRAARTLGLHYAGIDIAETNNGYVVFEVNASPNWRGLSMVSNINPAKYIAEYVMSLIKR